MVPDTFALPLSRSDGLEAELVNMRQEMAKYLAKLGFLEY